MTYGFKTMNLQRIEAWIVADNIRSHRVALRLGLEHQLILSNHWYGGESLHDIYVYAIEQGSNR